jgi:hypothetical protein
VHDVMSELLLRDPVARPGYVASTGVDAGSAVADAGGTP